MFAVCVRFRVAVDADIDQHGPVPVHRRASVPVAIDARPSGRTHGDHLDDRVDVVHARAVLVPRTGRRGRHHIRVYDRVP